jgi:ribosomal-protein-alanine N-acetyltransferase
MANSAKLAVLPLPVYAMPAFLPVELHTPRLNLRFLTSADVAAMFQLFSDPDAVRYWSCAAWQDMAEASSYVEQTLQSYAEGSALRWAMLTADGELVGVVTLYHFDRRNYRCDIGYMLARPYWGQRYMQEALRAVLDYGFGSLGLHRIEADIHPDNSASVRLLQGLQFRLEGQLRERWFVNGEISDSLIYGLLARDWQAAASAIPSPAALS